MSGFLASVVVVVVSERVLTYLQLPSEKYKRSSPAVLRGAWFRFEWCSQLPLLLTGEVGLSQRKISVKWKLGWIQHLTWLVHPSPHLAELCTWCSIEMHYHSGVLQLLSYFSCSNLHIIFWFLYKLCCSFPVTESCPTLWPQGLQYTRLPCPSPTLKVCSNSCPLNQWCHPTVSSSFVPFSSYLQSFPASGSFPMSWLFASGGQSIGASVSASVLQINTQGWFPLELTGLISLLSHLI